MLQYSQKAKEMAAQGSVPSGTYALETTSPSYETALGDRSRMRPL